MKQFGIRHHELIAAELQSADTIMKALAERSEPFGRESLYDPRTDSLVNAPIDVYIRGIVRSLNEAQIYTTLSCDGHNKKAASIHFLTPITDETVTLLTMCAPPKITLQTEGNQLFISYPFGQRELLLTYAETLFNALFEQPPLYKLETIKNQLLHFLSIPGVSRRERTIRANVERHLKRYCDFTFCDRYGNLLGVLELGEGPTLLLSAHLDVVEAFAPDRTINENGTILTSSAGILGADDRAGVTAVLAVIRQVRATQFSGTIKVAFTVEEEIGCRGSQHLYHQFLDDVAGAIVFDRRGTRDIITHCGDTTFCDDDYSERFVLAGQLAGMPDWTPVRGGLSDARIFAQQFAIPSVNLSVGYGNEHCDDEFVDYYATYETIQLVMALLHHNLLRD